MAASVFSSALYGDLFPTGAVGRLWSDSAEVRAMLLVEGSLARVQGDLGVIPQDSAAFIHRSALEVQIDPAGLAAETGQNGVCVPALVAAFRKAMEAPEHAQYVHWGATSQDIIDTALMLRLRQTVSLQQDILRALLGQMGAQAQAHAETPMVARTYGQHATPTSWGAVLAQVGHPLLEVAHEAAALQESGFWVSLSGAAGTAAALGPQARATRAALAQALGLRDPGRSWHVDRGPLLRVTDVMGRSVAILAGLGQTLIDLAASDVGEISLGAVGASSTMPQKQNPVAPSALVALGHHMTGLQSTMQAAASHRHQRDGTAWFAEWMVVPQIALATASALTLAQAVMQSCTPNADRMAATLGRSGAFAEALSFALAQGMPRPEAQAATKALVAEASASGSSLATVARAAHPNLPTDLFEPHAQLGSAPAEARAFADMVTKL